MNLRSRGQESVYDVATRDVESELERERRLHDAEGNPMGWFVRLNKEAVETLVSIGVHRSSAEIAVFDLLRTSAAPDEALEGLIVLQRTAARTGDLPALAREFGVGAPAMAGEVSHG